MIINITVCIGLRKESAILKKNVYWDFISCALTTEQLRSIKYENTWSKRLYGHHYSTAGLFLKITQWTTRVRKSVWILISFDLTRDICSVVNCNVVQRSNRFSTCCRSLRTIAMSSLAPLGKSPNHNCTFR